MTSSMTCPAGKDLLDLVATRHSQEEIETLATHLDHCDRCAQAVDHLLTSNPPFAFGGMEKDCLSAVDRERVSALIARLQQIIRIPPPSVGESLTDQEKEALNAIFPKAAVWGSAPEDHDFLAPPRGPGELGRLGPYRVLEVLGSGGMGVVFRAEDPDLRREVALKAMKPALAASASARLRFLREARAAATLQHDHVVTIHQVGEDRGIPYLAMELLQGESLATRLERQAGPLPLAEVLQIGREIAGTLAVAHAHGLIHRDVKPENIWLESKPVHCPPPSFSLHAGRPTGMSTLSSRVKLLDFGLVREAIDRAAITQPGAVMGTPAYMAPEQAAAEAVDARADLFSLGCVLYRLATGRAAFTGHNELAIMQAVREQTPRPPSDVNPALPANVSVLIQRLLGKMPEQRPNSAQDVVTEIDRVAATELDKTASPATPAKKVSRRIIGMAAVASVVAVSLLGYFLGVPFYHNIVGRQEVVVDRDEAASRSPRKPNGQFPEEGVDHRGPTRESSEAVKPKPDADGRPPAGWQVYSNPALNFTALLPEGKIDLDERKAPDNVITWSILLQDLKALKTCNVMVMDLGKDSPLTAGLATLDLWKTALTSKSKALSEKTIALDGHPGFELEAEVQPGVLMQCRGYYVAGKIYVLTAGRLNSPVTAAGSKVFLDSFRLIKPVPVQQPPGK